MYVCCRWLVAIVGAIGLAFGIASPVYADPPAQVPPHPFPDLADVVEWYNQFQPDEFLIPPQRPVLGDTEGRPYLWFLSPSGLNCGIWFWGGFGCSGDIPGAPPGDTHIAWFNGNRAVHHGWSAAMQFPPGQAQRTLPPRSYVTYNSTTCAVTPEGNIYCAHGEFRLLITPQGTWLKGWDDRRSYVCNAYASCPPG